MVAWLEKTFACRNGDRPRCSLLLRWSPADQLTTSCCSGLGRAQPVTVLLDPRTSTGTDLRRRDLRDKPRPSPFRETYYSGYGPGAAIEQVYKRNSQRYRDMYYRLHAEVDGPLDRVRRAVQERLENAVLVRTSPTGMLGAHGGLHQKWFNLYDEATRSRSPSPAWRRRPDPAQWMHRPRTST